MVMFILYYLYSNIKCFKEDKCLVWIDRGGAVINFMVTKPYDNTRGLRIKQSDGKYVRFLYAKTSFILPEK